MWALRPWKPVSSNDLRVGLGFLMKLNSREAEEHCLEREQAQRSIHTEIRRERPNTTLELETTSSEGGRGGRLSCLRDMRRAGPMGR